MKESARLNQRSKKSPRVAKRRVRQNRVKPSRRNRNSGVSLELLEPRTLLSADFVGAFCDSACAAVEAGLKTSPLELSQLSSGVVRAADAGSTFGTADDLGELNGQQTFYGSVGRRDPADVVRFSLANDADVVIQLGGLRSDIDLALYNSGGQRIGLSNRAGSASESISLTLDSGIYYVGITPWRRAVSSYVLTTNVAFITSPTDNPADTIDAPDSGATDPADSTDTPNSTDPPDPTDPDNSDDSVSVFPDVAYYGGSNEWNLNAINAPESWAAGYTGEGVTVAVIDTGVDLDHADLVNQIWVNPSEVPGNGIDDDQNGYVDDIHGWDFIGNDNSANDLNGHGTHVAGTIAAGQNGFGATGVAPDATIMPVRVLDRNGYGSDSAVAAGIRYAAANGADIINLSLGGTFSFVIQSAIRFAQQLDVLVVAASGNEYASVPSYPARFSASMNNVISVGAHSRSNRVAGFSNDVGSSEAVQVDAPGVSVFSTITRGRYASFSGTSMAAPHVAGLAALALSANNDLNASQLRSLIVDGADRIISGTDSHGGINAAVTVALAAAGQTSSVSASSNSTQSISQWFFTPWSFVSSTALPGSAAQSGYHDDLAFDSGTASVSSPLSEDRESSPAIHDQALDVLLSTDATSAEVAADNMEASVTEILAESAAGRFDRAAALGEALSEDWIAIDLQSSSFVSNESVG